jgi:hypothetical protein
MMTQTAHGPFTSAPLRVRPPYDQRDIAGAQRQNETVQQWWDHRRVDGMDALLTPLAGIDVSDYDRYSRWKSSEAATRTSDRVSRF